MKKSTILFLVLIVSLSSCENDLSTNSLLNNYLNINAGDSYEVCYQKLQDLYNNEQVNSMYADNVSFSTITNFSEQIELYTEFQIKEKDNSYTGDRIAFVLNKDTLQYLLNLDKIDPLTAGPTSIKSWPESLGTPNALKVGDKKDTVTNKITRLSEEGVLTTKMEKISYTSKDLSTSYDTNLEKSSYWSILKSFTNTDKTRTYFIIHFNNGVVYGIEILEVQIVGLN